mmetsp:Transcript_15981/g.32758  ORF Transcript_15981/g.32758 Transcript_15981/m.32758 type:complete len:213 (-) Transcript_15981:245-883(-)
MTKRRVGSQVPSNSPPASRKPSTCLFSIIPPVARPIEKSAADRLATRAEASPDGGVGGGVETTGGASGGGLSGILCCCSREAADPPLATTRARKDATTNPIVSRSPVLREVSVGSNSSNAASLSPPCGSGDDDDRVVAARTPVPIKARTAQSDRLLRRARPQIPCPEVHPLPSVVPNPTRKPETIKLTKDVVWVAVMNESFAVVPPDSKILE